MNDLKAFGYAQYAAARLQGKFDLTASFDPRGVYVHLWRYRVTMMRGRKYHRIVIQSSLDTDPNWEQEQRMCLCFVDDDGNIYMSGGWKTPAKGIRYNIATAEGLAEFIDNADPYGSFLYANYKKVGV